MENKDSSFCVQMKIVDPIFIIGTGRCGSTLLHKILSHHPNTAWLSYLSNKYPKKIWINRTLLSLIDVFPLNKILRRISATEAYDFWEHYIGTQFSVSCRDLVKEDVTNDIKPIIDNALSKNLLKNKNRLLIKLTGWPRVGYLKELYPDAKFVHVYRDGRAVANSLIHTDWWQGWRGPQNWRWGELNQRFAKEWEEYDKSFVILAALQWKILMDAFETALKKINKNDYMEIKYEKLIENPINIIKQVTKFTNLQWIDKFENYIKKINFKNMNYKWEEDLTERDKKNINKFLYEYLLRYGYV